ncbi:MAG: thrombospondin type-1 domain-containing protein [Bdellovibrionota bacterium]
MKKSSFRFNFLFMFVITTVSLGLLSCTKNKSQEFANEGPTDVSPSCGAIDMSPPNNLYPNKTVNFEIIPPTGITLNNIQWNFLKGSTNILSTTTTTVSHMFNGANEGSGSYVAKATFQKSDGNSCALEKAFQILAHDICVNPTGISGPTIGYVNEETSPFSINAEPCFQGQILWDMNNDGVNEYTLAPDAFTSHTYTQTGTYTVKAIAINFEQDEQPAFFHTIDIRNKSCINPFTNAVVAHGETVEFAKQSAQCGGKPCDTTLRACINGVFETGGNAGTFTQNPATCQVSPSCPATYSWEASQFGACTGPCESSAGTRPITNYICKKTVEGNTTTAPDAECVTGVGAKPTGQTQNCTVPPENQTLNCLSCGSTPHGGSITQWAKNPRCGVACNSQSRICNNGVIPSFDPGYAYPSQQMCPITECPPEYTYTWYVGDYGACSAIACGTEGTQTRRVTCIRNDGAAVEEALCTTPKPSTTKTCFAEECSSSDLKGSSCHAFAGTMITWSDPSTGKVCIGNLFGNLMVGETLQVGGTQYDNPNITPWDKASRKGSAKVICNPKPDTLGMLPFKVESGTCKEKEEPNLIKTPLINQEASKDCKGSPVTQQAFGTGQCAVYRQGSSGDMPLKGTFLYSGGRKYVAMGEFTDGFEHVFSHGKGKIFTSSAMNITYNGETKDLTTSCGDMDADAPKNSTCSNTATATIGGVTFTMGVGAKNTVDPKGYVPEYLGSFKNTNKTEVWTQKTCAVVTVSTSLGYLPPPCP